MAQEFELKYRLTPAAADAIFSAFPGPWTQTPMHTVYYDTPDASLSRLCWTLRCRREGEVSVCTLKTPGKNNARGEWETPHTDILQALPILAREAELPQLLSLTGGGLVPTCAARFTRRATLLTLAGGTIAELALDSGSLHNGDRSCPLAEAELELKSGAPEALTAYAAAFAARFGLEPEPKSKFARAAALAQEV